MTRADETGDLQESFPALLPTDGTPVLDRVARATIGPRREGRRMGSAHLLDPARPRRHAILRDLRYVMARPAEIEGRPKACLGSDHRGLPEWAVGGSRA